MNSSRRRKPILNLAQRDDIRADQQAVRRQRLIGQGVEPRVVEPFREKSRTRVHHCGQAVGAKDLLQRSRQMRGNRQGLRGNEDGERIRPAFLHAIADVHHIESRSGENRRIVERDLVSER